VLQLIRAAQAQDGQVPNTIPAGWEDSALESLTFCSLLNMVLNVVFWGGVLLATAFIAIGGFKYMSSQGDPKATDAARKTLTNAIIGFIIVIGAQAIKIIAARMLTGNGNLADPGDCNF